MKRLGPRIEERSARVVLWTMTIVTVAVLVFIVAGRQLVTGIMQGAVKG